MKDIERRPGTLASHDEVRDQHAGDRAMSHTHAGITGRHIDVRCISGIVTDKGQGVDWFHDLPGPSKFYASHHGEPLPCPGLQSRITAIAVVCLPGLMVFAPDDEHLFFAALL